MLIQQGDVLFYKMKSLPKNLEEQKTNIVQEGEATGHAHRLSGTNFQMFIQPETKKRYLRIVKATPLTHEEHKKIDLPEGEYEIGIVREYDHWDEESRAVID
jgi:hypothetical protein